MELPFLAIYVSFSLLFYLIIDFKLKKNEESNKGSCADKNALLESGIRRLEEDYQRSLAQIQADIKEIKSKLQ